MKNKTPIRPIILEIILLTCLGGKAWANPDGMTVQSGTATTATLGSQLNINVSQAAVLGWQSFNINSGEGVVFHQPSAGSIVLNQIYDQNPSQILGSLQANGIVILQNKSGFYFGKDSFVQAGGLVISTAGASPLETSGGAGFWQFNGPPPSASIINYGRLQTTQGGSLFLIAENIENHGQIEAPGGNIGLYAGQSVLVSERPDGRSLSAQVTLPSGSINNLGAIVADAGSIALNAKTINQDGLIQANSVRAVNGQIELVASDSIQLGESSIITASGDSTGQSSDAGRITVKSGGTFQDSTSSAIRVAGGISGGNGGQVEISANDFDAINSKVDGSAQIGSKGGSLLIDPTTINVVNSGSGSAGNGTVGSGSTPATLNLNPGAGGAFTGFSTIDLQATGNITVSSLWNLNNSTGISTPGSTLTLEAGGNIVIGNNAGITAGTGWSINLAAGRDFTKPLDFSLAAGVRSALGNITVNGPVQSQEGSISLLAGNAITVGITSITTQAGGNINLKAIAGNIALNNTWNLNDSPVASLLSLQAGGDITIPKDITVGAGWTVGMVAGRDFSSALDFNKETGAIKGTGSILLVGKGNGSIQAQDGSISLLAGNAITFGTGFIRTEAGGSIIADAVSGSVNTGSGANNNGIGYGYLFFPGFYTVDPRLTGISTAKGGDVTINAGADIISYLPVPGGIVSDAGSGAFGPEPGNVTLNALGNITGHYVIANGTGTIWAGLEAGTASAQLALSLAYGFQVNGVPANLDTAVGAHDVIQQNWTVTAGKDINLQEVRNPNGLYNDVGFGSNVGEKHFIDYSPLAYVTLTTTSPGGSVNLTGNNVPRLTDITGTSPVENNLPSIYPPSLTISTGSGGISIGPDVILFPSPVGQLNLTTTGTGSLRGTQTGAISQLVMSDSDKSRYQSSGDFGVADHAAIPVHETDYTPLSINIAGDMDYILISSPKVANIAVGGNMFDSRFIGQNLHSGDNTTITVAGDINNGVEFTSVPIPYAPNFSVFQDLYPALSGIYAFLPGSFSYNAAYGLLTFKGFMSGPEQTVLENLTVPVRDQYGNVETDSDGNILTQPAHFVGNDIIDQIFTGSQGIIGSNTGYLIGGTGKLSITAANLELGATAGIVSTGPRDNAALANYFTRGADIDLNLKGNLDMFSTTISTVNGGNISVNAGGSATIGSTFYSPGDSVARGIFTVDAGNVSVIAGGDVSINGSRIAAYDGGNITVESLTGNVDAGSGGTGSVSVQEIIVDPATRQIYSFQPKIPGSGILATTFPNSINGDFPESVNVVGNILVEAPQGDINASQGGVVQLPFNQVNSSGATVTLIAGSRDSSGRVTHVGNIDVTDSGVFGSTVNLRATGSIKGVIVARNFLGVNAGQNVNITAFSQGDAHISAGESLQGTVFAVGSISAGAGSVDASLLSQNVSTSGSVSSSSQLGFAQGTVANSTSSSLQSDDTVRRGGVPGNGDEDGDDLKKRGLGKNPLLTKTTGRVTMILPVTQ